MLSRIHGNDLIYDTTSDTFLFLDASKPRPILAQSVELAMFWLLLPPPSQETSIMERIEMREQARQQRAELYSHLSTDGQPSEFSTLNFSTPPYVFEDPEATGFWLWSEDAQEMVCHWRIFGMLAPTTNNGADAGQQCWTIPSKPAAKEIENDVGGSRIVYRVPMQFKRRNGKGTLEKVLSHLDFDVQRPQLSQMGYVVRGEHKGTIIKVVKFLHDKTTNAINGFQGKLHPHDRKAPNIVVGPKDVTKIESLLPTLSGRK